MRALHIFADPALTHGASIFEYRVSECLQDTDIRFDYLVQRPLLPEHKARYDAVGSRVFHLPIDEKHGLIVQQIKANFAYYKFFKAHDYQIVYADTENALRALHLLMARLAGVPVRVLHSHNTALQTQSKASRAVARAMRHLFRLSATHYFACSDAAAEWLFPASVYRRKRFTVLKNGVDLNAFRYHPETRARMRRSLGMEESLVLGHVGRFMPQKNHAFLIEIFAQLVKLRPDARLLLVGDGPLRPEIESLAREKGLAERVRFLGNVENVSDCLQAMDAFVFPSLYEGLPITGIEAQAAGLPCLFSDRISRELAVTPLAQFLSIDSAPENWARAILTAAARPRADAANAIAAAGYSIRDTANALRDFYHAARRE